MQDTHPALPREILGSQQRSKPQRFVTNPRYECFYHAGARGEITPRAGPIALVRGFAGEIATTNFREFYFYELRWIRE
jgi:hypothetical protein